MKSDFPERDWLLRSSGEPPTEGDAAHAPGEDAYLYELDALGRDVKALAAPDFGSVLPEVLPAQAPSRRKPWVMLAGFQAIAAAACVILAAGLGTWLAFEAQLLPIQASDPVVADDGRNGWVVPQRPTDAAPFANGPFRSPPVALVPEPSPPKRFFRKTHTTNERRLNFLEAEVKALHHRLERTS